MKAYEFVIVADPQLSKDQLDAKKTEIEGLFDGAIKQTDDLGLQQFHYLMQGKRHLSQGFVLVYHIELEIDALREVQKQLGYMKEVIRAVPYVMANGQEFMAFKDIEAKAAEIAEHEEWTVKKKLTMFADKKYDRYLVWQAVGLLKKFMTRFGDIKPRKYTGISVQQQKKVRKAILRARELGLLPYTR